jgi:hypothetical protein
VLTVSATLVHPLTETRLPTLAQTSALATLAGCTTAYISGIDVRAKTAIPAAVQDRTHRTIAISFRQGRGLFWSIRELRAAVYSPGCAMRPEFVHSQIALGECRQLWDLVTSRGQMA